MSKECMLLHNNDRDLNTIHPGRDRAITMKAYDQVSIPFTRQQMTIQEQWNEPGIITRYLLLQPGKATRQNNTKKTAQPVSSWRVQPGKQGSPSTKEEELQHKHRRKALIQAEITNAIFKRFETLSQPWIRKYTTSQYKLSQIKEKGANKCIILFCLLCNYSQLVYNCCLKYYQVIEEIKRIMRYLLKLSLQSKTLKPKIKH